jgi:hypothetical protein
LHALIDDKRNRSKWLPRNVHVAIVVGLEDGSNDQDPTNPASFCHDSVSLFASRKQPRLVNHFILWRFQLMRIAN